MKHAVRMVSAAALVMTLASPAHPIVINDSFGTADALTLANPYSGVVSLSVGCTGALLSATVVLTAQHCTYGTGREASR